MTAGRPEHPPDPATSTLRIHRQPDQPRCAVLLLHGGRADGLAPPRRPNLPDLRLRPFGTAVRRAVDGALGESGALIAGVRYRHRGWNWHHAHPVQDAHSALNRLTDVVGDMPILLVGHSMGGRAALAVAGHPAVRGVIALAPWCPPGEPVAHLRGRTIAFLHDESDRVTSAQQTWDFARRAADAGAQVNAVAMPHGGHTMLRAAARWHRLTAEHAVRMLSQVFISAEPPPPAPHGSSAATPGPSPSS